jgi:hypothetical protein
MRKIFLIYIIALLALFSCSKSKGGVTPENGQQTGQAQGQVAASGETALQIKAVALQPETPTVLDDVAAKPALASPGLEKVTFRYQWFVNGKEVLGINGADLEKTHYKKGAWIYCRVKAVSDKIETEWFKSDAIRVLNSLPVLHLPPMENFPVPGEISFQAAASDADNDPLTFEVLAPKDQGIEIDPKTGLLSWKIDADTVGRLGETIEIKLAVSDGEGQKVTGTITLQLTSTKQTSPQ